MSQERIIWAGGINRSLDPRHIEKHEQYDAYNLEVVQRGTLSKRKGFGRWRTSNNTFAGTVRGEALMYDSDGNRYLFVFYDAGSETDLWIEKAGGTPLIIENFFPTAGHRVRSAVFGDRIYFVNGVDRPRWYKEYTGSAHVWGIAGVPSPARRPADESSFDYFISRALYADCITSSEDLGIDPPGIWQYKQTVGYYGKTSDEQVEESNAGPASKMFHCQFNTAEALGTQLQGYIEKGIPIGIADFDDLILDAGEAGGQDYEDEIRWMRMYRRFKMYSDELFSPFEFLVEMKKGWPTSIRDVYNRDSAVVAPTTRVQIPVAHHIESANNRMFLGRVEKELFTQPGLPANFRGETTYKPNFSYRMPITVHSTNPKTLTGAVIPLRFQNGDDTKHTATPPAGGGTWTGAYTQTTLFNYAAGWYELMVVDEDGVTPLGFCKLVAAGAGSVTLLVEIPEIAAGGSRTIYLYFVDSQLSPYNPESYSGSPGHWKSIAHYPLCASDHWLLADFENWDAALAIGDVTQKRSLGYIADGILGGASGGADRVTVNDSSFFNKLWYYSSAPILRILSSDATVKGAGFKFFPPAASSTLFSVAILAKTVIGDATGTGNVILQIADSAGGTATLNITFSVSGTTVTAEARIWDTDLDAHILTLSGTKATGCIGANGDWLYYLVTVDGSEFTFSAVYGTQNGHAGEGAAWDDTTHYNKYSTSRNDISKAIQFSLNDAHIGATVKGVGGNGQSSWVYIKEIQVFGRKISGNDELIHMLNRDSYFPTFGLATAEDRESQTGEKRPDRMYFSKLNQPNSVEAVDFRDMGELGRPIQGIRGIHNRVFVFDENKIRALFSAGAEQTLALASGDTTSWILSQDLTGERGGIGVLAPDSLVNMEFAGRDGVGFLSKRGFYFFDGNGFTHISEKVDNIIYDDEMGANSRKNLTAHFLGKKRQLLLGTLIWDDDPDNIYGVLVANMKFAQSELDIVWADWNALVRYGVELDFSIDTGQFVYVNVVDDVHGTEQILKLEGNTSPNVYKDTSADSPSGFAVGALAMSKQFDVFDAELLKCDLHTSGDDGYSVELRFLGDSLVEALNDPKISGATNGMYRFPIGTNAKLFLFRLYDNTAFRCVFEKLDFYFNVHGERRLA